MGPLTRRWACCRSHLELSREEEVHEGVLVELKHVDSDLEGVLARVAVDDLEELVDTARGEAGVRG